MAVLLRKSLSFRLSSLFLVFIVLNVCLCENVKDLPKDKDDKAKQKIGKNILDYTEADMSKLLDQWEDNDEDDDDEDKYDDDDPRKPKPQMPAFDPTKLKDDPMAFLKLSKKGKILMLFVAIADNPTKSASEKISARWQTSLHNANLQVERYLVADDRVLFLLKDGSIAWEVKDFIITQPECKMVEFDQQKFPGFRFKDKEEKTEL